MSGITRAEGNGASLQPAFRCECCSAPILIREERSQIRQEAANRPGICLPPFAPKSLAAESCHGSRRRFHGSGSSLEQRCCAAAGPSLASNPRGWLWQSVTVPGSFESKLPNGVELSGTPGYEGGILLCPLLLLGA